MSQRATIGCRATFLLFSLSLVGVGSAMYLAGDALEVEALETAGGFVAGMGLLAIIPPTGPSTDRFALSFPG
jgi:hypothetical protein